MKPTSGYFPLTGVGLSLFLFACNSPEKDRGPARSELIGHWSLDSMAVDGTIVTTGAGTRDIDTVLTDSGSYLELRDDDTYTFVPPPDFTGFDVFAPHAGTWSLSGSALTLTGSFATSRYQVAINGGVLILSYAIDMVMNWPWSGDVDAKLDVVFTAAKP